MRVRMSAEVVAQCRKIQSITIRYRVMQHNTHHSTTHNTTQHNTIQYNTTQHNTTQHNTTQHNTEVDVSGAQYCSFITAEPYGFSTYLVRATAVPPHRRWTWGAEPRLGLKEGVAV
jgi:endonuclease/exonuclease/phosphatase (EEP) superfamily protein YafD